MSFEVGALTADAVVTSVHAVYDRANLGNAKLAGVIGMGGVGQIILQLLKNLGLTVVAISRSEEKLRVSRDLGADHVLRAGEPSLSAEVRKFNAGGLDVVFDCVGSEESMKDALAVTRRCGRIVMVGEERALFPADSTRIAQSELELVGSRNGTRSNARLGLELLRDGKIKPFVSDLYPLEESNEALDKLRTGAAGRVVVVVGSIGQIK